MALGKNAARQAIASHHYDISALDWHLPEVDDSYFFEDEGEEDCDPSRLVVSPSVVWRE